MAKPRVALIAGVTGIVGEALSGLLSKPDTPGGPWKVYGLARRPQPDWLTPGVIYIQCNLLNQEDTLAKIAPLTDVTHLFWVTWVAKSTEAENCAENGRMFGNTLDALLPNANLEHIVLQTGGKHYLGPFEAASEGYSGVKPLPFDTPYTEDLPRQPLPNFYYTLEDMLFEAAAKMNGRLTWSVHRPGVIFGVTSGNYMNLLETLAVYGAICKHEGLPFAFPGNRLGWESVLDASNADLIAEQEVWATTDPRAKNSAFNIVNGDVFKWKKLWKLLSAKLGLDYVPYTGRPTCLSEVMKDKGHVWDKIVKENGLYPSKLEDVGHWWFADVSLSPAGDNLLSMNKSKEHGFLKFRNTEKTFLTFIEKMRARKLIPGVPF